MQLSVVSHNTQKGVVRRKLCRFSSKLSPEMLSFVSYDCLKFCERKITPCDFMAGIRTLVSDMKSYWKRIFNDALVVVGQPNRSFKLVPSHILNACTRSQSGKQSRFIS